MSARGSARRGVHDDPTEDLSWHLAEAIDRPVNIGPPTYYEISYLKRAAARAAHVVPEIAAVIENAEDPFTLPLATYKSRLDKIRRHTRIVPAADKDLEHVGHVCGATRAADLRLLRARHT